MKKFLHIFMFLTLVCVQLHAGVYKATDKRVDEIEIVQGENVPAFSTIFFEGKNNLIFAGAENLITIFNAQTLEHQYSLFDRIIGKVNTIRADSKNAYIACGNYNISRVLKLTLDKKIANTLFEFDEEILDMAISSDEALLAIAGANGKLFIFDLQNEKILFDKKISNAKVVSVEFSQNSQSLACAISNGEVAVYERADGFSEPPKKVHINGALRQISFMQNSQVDLAAISGYGSSAKMYIIPRLTQRSVKQNELREFNPVKIIPRKRYRMYVCATNDGKLLHLRTSLLNVEGNEFEKVEAPLADLCEAPLGIFAASKNGKIFFWENGGRLSCGIECLNFDATKNARWIHFGTAYSNEPSAVQFKSKGSPVDEKTRGEFFEQELLTKQILTKTTQNKKAKNKKQEEKNSQKNKNTENPRKKSSSANKNFNETKRIKK